MIRREGILRASVVVVAALLLGSGGPITHRATPLALIGRAAQPEESPVSSDCSAGDAGGQPATAEAAPSFTAPDGSGFAVDLLAAASVAEVPAGALRLALRRVALEPGQGADSYDSQGPILYYVRSGTVTFIVNAREQVRPEGSCLAVPVGTEVGYVNDADPATRAELLRVSLAPPDTEDRQITSFIESTSSDGTSPPVSELLFWADVTTPPRADAWLFLAAVTWDAPSTDAAWQRLPGPVGLHVERGALALELANGRRDLGERGCAYLASDVVYRGSVTSTPTTVLLGGVLPAGAQLWVVADPPGPGGEPVPLPAEVRCSE